MALTSYTLDQLRAIVLDHIRGRLPGANISENSDYWHFATIVSIVANGDQAAALYLVKQVLPATADDPFVLQHAAARKLNQQNASAAQGKILIGGTADGPTVSIGSTFTHASGQTYKSTTLGQLSTPAWTGKLIAPGTTLTRVFVNPDASGMAVDDALTIGGQTKVITAVLPDTGTPIAIDLDSALNTLPFVGDAITAKRGDVVHALADKVGAGSNRTNQDAVTLSSPPSNVNAAATIIEMTGGGDDELIEELRARTQAFMAERPGSGNRAHYREWARETPGVRLADAFVYPAYRGLGTADLVPFGVSATRATGQTVNSAIQAHLDSEASTFDDKLVRQLIDGSPQAITVQIDPHAGFEPDFSGSFTQDPTQASASAVKLTTNPAAVIEIGDRVLVRAGTSAPRLYQRTVVGIDAANKILTLDQALPTNPSTSGALWAGGPLAQPIIDAFAVLFDSLGPGDTVPASRFPGEDVWPATLQRALIFKTIKTVDGVFNVVLPTPAADVTPAAFTRVTLGQLEIQWV